MKRLLIYTVLGALVFSADAYAKITTINEWIKGGKNNKSLYEDFANSFHEKTCQQVYGDDSSEIKPEGKQCNSQMLGLKVCYYNCHCPSDWKSCADDDLVGNGDACIEKNGDRYFASCICNPQLYGTCTEPAIGDGDTCTIGNITQYTSCKCPNEYNQDCIGTDRIGNDDDSCTDDKGTHYKSCRCPNDYKICTGDAGEGEPCIFDGINKYQSCLYGEVSNVCRAITEETPFDNSPEYSKHTNAFRGIENTKFIRETLGTAATAANAAFSFYPNEKLENHQYFGKEKWYLPAVGEMLYLSDADFSHMTGIDDNSMTLINGQPQNVIKDETYNKVNAALITLQNAVSENDPDSAKKFVPFLHPSKRGTDNYVYSAYDHWTSSYGWNDKPYFWAAPTFFNQKHSGVYQNIESYGWPHSEHNDWSWYHFVRPVLMLQSCFNNKPINIGDVVFAKTNGEIDVGSADSYEKDDDTRYPVGVIYWISKNKENIQDNQLVRIISVKPVPFIGSGDQWNYDLTDDPANYPLSSYAGYRVSAVNKKDDNFDKIAELSDINTKDNWGCSTLPTLSDSPSCKNTPQPRATMTCTPKIKKNSTDYEPEFEYHTNAFKGIEYTNAIIKEHPDATGSAAHLAAAFHGLVESDNTFFGAGKWYLPSAGEMLYLAGAYISVITGITDPITGYNGNTDYTTVNNSLISTQEQEIISSECTPLADNAMIWTSSEVDKDNAYYWDSTDRQIKSGDKKDLKEVRPVIMLRDPHFVGEAPKVGSLVSLAMESLNFPIDESLGVNPWRGHSSDYPVGVVYYVSPDQRIVRIIACKSASDSPVPWLSAGDTVDIQTIPNNTWGNIPQGAPLEMSKLFNGKENTKKIFDALHENALAAYAATQFYAPGVAANDKNFGKGQWYLPALGELMDMYGYDWDAMYEAKNYTKDYINSEKSKISSINTALTALGNNASTLTNARLWASTPVNATNVFNISLLTYNDKGETTNTGGIIYNAAKNVTTGTGGSRRGVRVFRLFENEFFEEPYPAVGDIMYSDLTYGGLDNTKTPVGVVVWVSEDGHSARIINLKFLYFKNTFNPDAPYDADDVGDSHPNSEIKTIWSNSKQSIDGLDETGGALGTDLYKFDGEKNEEVPNPGTSKVLDDECSLD